MRTDISLHLEGGETIRVELDKKTSSGTEYHMLKISDRSTVFSTPEQLKEIADTIYAALEAKGYKK